MMLVAKKRTSVTRTSSRATRGDTDTFVEVTKGSLENVALESTRTIEIDEFVDRSDIDPHYLIRPYYLRPDGKVGHDAFAVIRETIREMDKVAIGRVVQTNREHVIALEPLGPHPRNNAPAKLPRGGNRPIKRNQNNRNFQLARRFSGRGPAPRPLPTGAIWCPSQPRWLGFYFSLSAVRTRGLLTLGRTTDLLPTAALIFAHRAAGGDTTSAVLACGFPDQWISDVLSRRRAAGRVSLAVYSGGGNSESDG